MADRFIKNAEKKYTEEYKKAVLEGCREVFEKCVDKTQFQKGYNDKYWDLYDEVRDGDFVLHVQLERTGILDHAHPDLMKKECMTSRTFGEFAHQKQGLVNEVYVTEIPIETKDGGFETKKCDIVFE